MQTDTVFGYQVEEGDFLVMDGEPVGEVSRINDQNDTLVIETRDEDGDPTLWPIGPFDTATIATALDEDVEFEDVPIED